MKQWHRELAQAVEELAASRRWIESSWSGGTSGHTTFTQRRHVPGPGSPGYVTKKIRVPKA